jgi:L-ribulokinase
MIGLEAGQSAFGDVYAWFGKLLMWPMSEIMMQMNWLDEGNRRRLLNETSDSLISELSRKAASLNTDDVSVVSLDWLNGRRTPDANQALKGPMPCYHGSDAPKDIQIARLKPLLWLKMRNERFISEGVRMNRS